VYHSTTQQPHKKEKIYGKLGTVFAWGGKIPYLILNHLLAVMLIVCCIPLANAQMIYGEWDEQDVLNVYNVISGALYSSNDTNTLSVEVPVYGDRAIFTITPYFDQNASFSPDLERAEVTFRLLNGSYSDSSGSHHDGGIDGAIIKVTSGISLNRAARVRMISLQRGGSLMLGQNEKQSGIMLGQEPCEPCNPCGLLCGDNASGKRSAWVNYVGRQDSASNGFGEWTSDANGVQFGSDLFRTNRDQFGLQASYENAKFKSGFDKLLDDEYVFGAYAAHVFRSGSDFRVLANVGWQDFTAKNLAVNLGKFKGNTFDVTLEYGKRFFPVQNAGIRPVIALDIHDVHTDAYKTIDGSEYNKVRFTQTYFRVGTDYITLIKRLSLKSEIYYNYDLSRDSFKVNWKPGDAWRTDKLFLGRQFVELGLTAQYDFRNNVALFGSFFLDGYFDRPSRPYQSVGTAGLSWVW
jgi:hypothetical protein